MIIDTSKFDFDAFFKKYKLERNDKMVENLVGALNYPPLALDFCLNFIKGQCLELEPLFVKDVSLAYLYSRDVIKSRWKRAERYISQSKEWPWYCANWNIKPQDAAIIRNQRWLDD